MCSRNSANGSSCVVFLFFCFFPLPCSEAGILVEFPKDHINSKLQHLNMTCDTVRIQSWGRYTKNVTSYILLVTFTRCSALHLRIIYPQLCTYIHLRGNDNEVACINIPLKKCSLCSMYKTGRQPKFQSNKLAPTWKHLVSHL